MIVNHRSKDTVVRKQVKKALPYSVEDIGGPEQLKEWKKAYEAQFAATTVRREAERRGNAIYAFNHPKSKEETDVILGRYVYTPTPPLTFFQKIKKAVVQFIKSGLSTN